MKITTESLRKLAEDPTVSIQQSAYDAAPCPYVGDVVDGWWLPEDLENPTVGMEFTGVKSVTMNGKTLAFARKFRIIKLSQKATISVRGPEDLTILNAPRKEKLAVRLLEIV